MSGAGRFYTFSPLGPAFSGLALGRSLSTASMIPAPTRKFEPTSNRAMASIGGFGENSAPSPKNRASNPNNTKSTFMGADTRPRRPWQHLYNGAWKRARAAYLLENPVCADHLRMEVLVEASVVDHIIPHKGNAELFWDRNNWQALCKQCHDSHKQSQERTGRVRGCDLSGMPLDPNHFWHN